MESKIKKKITSYSTVIAMISICLLVFFEWELSNFAIIGLCTLIIVSIVVPLIIYKQWKYLLILVLLTILALILPCV